MAHPFSLMFEKAIAQSRGDENHVLGKAEELREKGYSAVEIYGVLKSLHASLIQDADSAIVAEAVEEFAQYLPDADDEGDH